MFTAAPEVTMSGRLFELAVRARQFSLRLAFMIDVAYIGLGALGGAALGRVAGP